MTTRTTDWRRNREGIGAWEHRGKVAVAGWGQSPMDRRWDGKSLDKTMGAYAIVAAKKAIEDAGLKLDDIDGVITSPETRVGDTWAPRPFFAPPYDTEDGITEVSGEWLIKQMGLKKVTYIDSKAPQIGGMMGKAAQTVGDGLCKTALVIYPMGNIEGRYEQGGSNQNAGDYTRGNSVFTATWGYQSGAQMNALIMHQQYCRKYGKHHDMLAPFVMNQRRNGLMTPWGFYAQHEPYQITNEDYLASRFVSEPLRVLDCDRPVISCVAFIFTTADRARTMKQKPIYILNHAQDNGRPRSTMYTLEEAQEWSSALARMMWEGSGLGAKDVDVFNPYDGYSTFTQLFLEGFGWHGVKRGEALDFYQGDIRVEGPHPYCSGGGNLGTGRTRAALFSDSIEQLRGTAGKRQIKIRCETALAGCNNPGGSGFIMFSKHPS
ncbi:MAG: thiolase family protein [Dehalococcoidia bacterium]|nr:thiolase family protein [Dehalococcoidia bacterium]